jgi:hypothetical protein
MKSIFSILFLTCIFPMKIFAETEEHSHKIDEFLTSFGIKEIALAAFDSDYPSSINSKKNEWENNEEKKMCLDSYLSKENRYKNIVIESYKKSYNLQEASDALEETKTEFTKTYLNLLFLSKIQRRDPSKVVIEHANSNKNAYHQFEKNIKPKRIEALNLIVMPIYAGKYYNKVIETCISKS